MKVSEAVDVSMQVGVDVARAKGLSRDVPRSSNCSNFSPPGPLRATPAIQARLARLWASRSSTVGAGVAVGCARTSAARLVPNEVFALPYQSHWPRQECSDGSATVATWSTWQIREEAQGACAEPEMQL